MTGAVLSAMCLLVASPQPGPPVLTGSRLGAVTREVTRHLRMWRFADSEVLLSLMEGLAPTLQPTLTLRARQQYLLGRYRAAVATLSKLPSRADGGALAARARAALRVVGPMASHRTSSGSFIIRCPRGIDELLIPYAEDVLERSRRAMAKELGLVPAGPVRVEILPGARELAALSPLRLAEIRRTGTTGLSQDHRIMLITPRALATGYGWADTLAHEYVHYVLEVKARHRVPLWLHEGLARFLQARWRAPLPAGLEPLQRHRLAKGIEEKRLVPLQKMLPSFAKLKDHRQAALAYAQVASMILELHRAHGSAGLKRLLALLATGRGIDQAMRRVTGLPLAGFVTSWKAALLRQRLKPVPAYEPPPIRFSRGKISTPAKRTPSGRFRRLGAILRGRGHLAAAAVEYKKSLALLRGADADTANTLARLLLRLQRPAEAARVVARALPYGDHIAGLHVAGARAAERLGDLAAARAHLLRANQIDPFDPEIHCSLARLLAGEPAKKSAVALEKRHCTRLQKAEASR